MACMFAKMLNAILFARQNAIYAVVYVLACFREYSFLSYFFLLALFASNNFHLCSRNLYIKVNDLIVSYLGLERYWYWVIGYWAIFTGIG